MSSQVPLPPSLSALVKSQLHAHENVLGWLEVDLSLDLKFIQGFLVATNERLLSWMPAEDAALSADWACQVFPIEGLAKLAHQDYAGVGSLELLDAQKRWARWRFTLAHNVQAVSLQEAWNAAVTRAQELASNPLSQRLQAKTGSQTLGRCASCGEDFKIGASHCEICSAPSIAGEAPLKTARHRLGGY